MFSVKCSNDTGKDVSQEFLQISALAEIISKRKELRLRIMNNVADHALKVKIVRSPLLL